MEPGLKTFNLCTRMTRIERIDADKINIKFQKNSDGMERGQNKTKIGVKPFLGFVLTQD
jgi:hypothetical protein